VEEAEGEEAGFELGRLFRAALEMLLAEVRVGAPQVGL